MAAERNDDEIAAALHGLNAGHHDSTAEHAGSVHGEPVEIPKAKATPPAPKRPSAPPARPAAPLPPRPEPRGSSQSTTPPPASRSTSSRPAAPVRPTAPNQPAAYEQEVFDDGDETVLNDLPATPLDYRGPKPAPKRLR